MSAPTRHGDGPPGRPDPWAGLARFTPARIALGRAGGSLPTRPLLEFQLAHARARDAVHAALDSAALERALADRAWPTLRLASAASDRATYIRRPDLGRVLAGASRALLAAHAPSARRSPDATFACDGAFVIADGLSALAVDRHAVALLDALRPRLDPAAWRLAPVSIVTQGRVAIGDEIGAALGARLVVVLIGERPGLSAPDSLGAYLTWHPAPGRTNAERNCLSNIRPAGLGYALAAHKLAYLMTEARRRGLTGVELKEDAPALAGEPNAPSALNR